MIIKLLYCVWLLYIDFNILGNKLIENNHFDSGNISSTLGVTKNRRSQIKTLSSARQHNLNLSLLYVEFKRDAAEVFTFYMNIIN